MHVQVLIVGAGPTGLALACQCLQLGIQIRLIDKKSGRQRRRRPLACSIVFQRSLLAWEPSTGSSQRAARICGVHWIALPGQSSALLTPAPLARRAKGVE
jgi:glycine/D-amino acid oxidase-like deaminating enzyme